MRKADEPAVSAGYQLLEETGQASAPREEKSASLQKSQPISHKVDFLKPNVLSRDHFATFVNTSGLRTDTSKATYSFLSTLYWLAGCGACCFQVLRDNGPTQVTLGRDWRNNVYADTSPVTRMLSCLTPITDQFDFSDFTRVNSNIHHLSKDDIHLVHVPPGKYGKAIIDNKPLLLTASDDGGYHAFKTANFRFEGLEDTNTDVIHVGNAYVINVKRGFAVVGNAPNAENENEKFFILREGFYTLRSDVVKLNKTPVKTTLIQKAQTLKVSTFEPIELDVSISLAYKIALDKALTKFDYTNLQDEITFFVEQHVQTAVSAIIRDLKYTELMSFQAAKSGETLTRGSIAVNPAPARSQEEKGQANSQHTSSSPFENISAQIKSKLENAFRDHGVDVDGFRIADVKVSDPRLREKFQGQNEQVVERRAALSAATVERETTVTKASADADKMRIAAEGYAQSEAIRAQADRDAMLVRDEAMKGASSAAIRQALFGAARDALPHGATVIISDGKGIVDGVAASLLGMRNQQ